MNSREKLIQIIRLAPNISPDVIENIESIQDVEESTFDQTYLEFLEEQISLSPRGPDWTARLLKRKDAYLPYCSVPLIRGRLDLIEKTYSIRVDPNKGNVVHIEECEK
ncbi:hypothetical protein BH11VER1_BH11VER1_36420 [soil metagenome]